jgi:hypothetical protein
MMKLKYTGCDHCYRNICSSVQFYSLGNTPQRTSTPRRANPSIGEAGLALIIVITWCNGFIAATMEIQQTITRTDRNVKQAINNRWQKSLEQTRTRRLSLYAESRIPFSINYDCFFSTRYLATRIGKNK